MNLDLAFMNKPQENTPPSYSDLSFERSEVSLTGADAPNRMISENANPFVIDLFGTEL